MDEAASLVAAALGLGQEAKEMTVAQMALRAAVVYVVTVAFVRLAKKRFMGRATAFDVILGILLGSIVSRAVTGNAPFGPALAVVPGGSANVFARALGVPRDPVDATAQILEALACGRSRLVGLGRADDRWFTFNAGMGWDADVVAEVEQMRFRGLAATPLRYAATGLRQYYRQWRDPKPMTVEVPGVFGPTPVRVAFVSNTSTWTYLGSRAVHTNPGASFATGLGLFAMQSLGIPTVAHVLHEILRPGGDPRGRHVVRHDAVPLVRVSCEVPVALQLDGDHLGERTEVEFLSVPEALRVVV